MKEDCCELDHQPCDIYGYGFSFTWAKDQGLNDTAEAQNNSIVTTTMNILELCNALQCDFDRFWYVFWCDTETQVLVGDPREMLAAQACSDHFFTPFGGTRLRFENLLPFGRADIVVVDPPGLVTNNAEPLYTDSC